MRDRGISNSRIVAGRAWASLRQGRDADARVLGRVRVIDSRLAQRADRLAATERYVKLLPQPDEHGPVDRLNGYVERAAGRAGW